MKHALLILLAMSFLFVACAQPPSQQNTPVPTPEEIETPDPNATEIPEAAFLAQEALATKLDLPVDDVQLVSVEAREWANACLEVEQPGIACAQVIVPGFQFMLEVNGKTYEYRTNEDGSQIVAATKDENPAVTASRQALVDKTGAPIDQIELVYVEAREWANGCLEVEQPGLMCTQAIVPGFRVILSVNGKEYEFRTNLDASLVVSKTLAEIVLKWHREGGIAGFCDDLQITALGEVLVSTCKDSEAQGVTHKSLDAAQKAQFEQWLNSFSPITYTVSDPATVDALSQNLIFRGRGQQKATDENVNAILAWANDVYAAATADAPSRGVAPAPLLVIEPASGQLGSQVKIRGASWPLGKTVKLFWTTTDDSEKNKQLLTEVVVGGTGAFDVTVTVPTAWANGTAITDATLMLLAETDNGSIKANIEFSVKN